MVAAAAFFKPYYAAIPVDFGAKCQIVVEMLIRLVEVAFAEEKPLIMQTM